MLPITRPEKNDTAELIAVVTSSAFKSSGFLATDCSSSTSSATSLEASFSDESSDATEVFHIDRIAITLTIETAGTTVKTPSSNGMKIRFRSLHPRRSETTTLDQHRCKKPANDKEQRHAEAVNRAEHQSEKVVLMRILHRPKARHE